MRHMDATGCEPWNVKHHHILSGTRGATREDPQMLLLPAALTPTWASAELLATSHEVRCLHTLVQTVVKHGTDVQTMRRVKVIKFKTFNHQQSVRLYHVYQRSV